MTERETDVALEMDLDERLAESDEEEGEGYEHDVPQAKPVDYDRLKRWVIQRDGKDYVQYVGLLDLLHQVSGGHFSIYTHLVQAPTKDNGMLAIVEAKVELLEGPTEGPWRDTARSATGIGDASADSVNRMMAPHLCRMAETRAKGRALRDLLNIGLVTIEELGPGGPVTSKSSASDGADSQDGIVIQGKRYTRAEIWKAYQGRMSQMREANLPIGQGNALAQNAPLSQLAGATQNLKKKLAEAGKLPVPPQNGRNN